jgi:hypothetical protein
VLQITSNQGYNSFFIGARCLNATGCSTINKYVWTDNGITKTVGMNYTPTTLYNMNDVAPASQCLVFTFIQGDSDYSWYSRECTDQYPGLCEVYGTSIQSINLCLTAILLVQKACDIMPCLNGGTCVQQVLFNLFHLHNNCRQM